MTQTSDDIKEIRTEIEELRAEIEKSGSHEQAVKLESLALRLDQIIATGHNYSSLGRLVSVTYYYEDGTSRTVEL
jgi:uncharacterized protein (DUF3084 family)